jgi:hypothetical protein
METEIRDETSKPDAAANENDYPRTINTRTSDFSMIGELTRLAVRSRAHDQ